MSRALITTTDINQGLEERFGLTSSALYKSVIVLLIYWAESDYDFKSEADKLSELFTETFKYTVRRFRIPSIDGNLALNDEISTVVRLFSKHHSLIIIHYGGHGDSDTARPDSRAIPRKESVWAARSEISVKDMLLNWSLIQPQLGLGKGDFLVILDCCFGAQAARASSVDRVIPWNVELLVAAPMGCKTPKPGPSSFTHALIEEIQESFDKHGSATIRDIHQMLTHRNKKLMQTPVLFSHGTKKSIRLEPQLPREFSAGTVHDPEATLMLRMMTRSPLDQGLLDDIINWLTTYAPDEIFGLQVTDLKHRAFSVQTFVSETSSSRQSVISFDHLPGTGQKEVKREWRLFNWRLQDGLRSLLSLGSFNGGNTMEKDSHSEISSEDSEKAKVKQFLHEFKNNIVLLERVIERNVLAVPELFEESCLADAVKDPTSKDLGLVRSLQLLLENVHFKEDSNEPVEKSNFLEYPVDPKLSPPGTLICDTHPSLGSVLVEYSYYTKVDDETERRNNARMDHLVSILQEPDSAFHTPSCIKWTANPHTFRYALIFKNPCDESFTPITLSNILANPADDGSGSKVPRPTLEQRFILAQALGQTLLKWHEVGWVHESISSLNVVFFQNCKDNSVDFSKFYLCGFSFSRFTSQHSTARQTGDDFIRDVYQHPERQGSCPMERHTKEHDIYSFGVLLFEIGFWGRAPYLFNKLVKGKRVDQIREGMLKRMRPLGWQMGSAYESATRVCLEKEFGIEMDDRVQSELARAFEHRVLRKLIPGTKLGE